jgi:hypothetical protein
MGSVNDADKLRNLQRTVKEVIMDLEGYLAQSQPETFPFPIRTVVQRLAGSLERSQPK